MRSSRNLKKKIGVEVSEVKEKEESKSLESVKVRKEK
jgi:hypothetical protein